MAMSRYEQLDLLGSSHIGEVWKCIDTNTKDDVAGLRLSEQIGATAGWDYVWTEVLRHFREFKHEYVVPARDTDREQRLVIMELMRGSMRMVLDKQKTTLPGLVRTCLRRSLEAMVALHGAGLLHGDVRPEQLLFRNDGGIRLSFSIGLKPGGVVLLRQNYNQYLAPELVNPGAGLVGPQVDLYALGITAYELLVGSEKLAELVPGVGANSPEPQKQWLKWQSDLKSTLPPLKEIFKKVPEDLCRVIDGLVQKNTASRIPNAAAALALLDTTGRNSDDVLVPLAEIGLDPSPGYTVPSAQHVRGKDFDHFQGMPAPPGVGAPSEPIAETRFDGTGGAGSYSNPPARGADNSNSQGGGGAGYNQPPNQVAQPVVSVYSPPSQKIHGVYQQSPQHPASKNAAKRPVWKDPFIFYGSLLSLLIAMFLGGFELYSKYINPERTEYFVTVTPPDAEIVRGKDALVDLKDGKGVVRVYPGDEPSALTVSATGYISQTTEELEFTKSDGKESGPIELGITLQPIVTRFSLTVAPVDAKLEVVKFPTEKATAETVASSGEKADHPSKKPENDVRPATKGKKTATSKKPEVKAKDSESKTASKNSGKSKSEKKTSEPESTDAAESAVTATEAATVDDSPQVESQPLYQLVSAGEPGCYFISVPFDSEVTLAATAEGFKKNETIVLKGTGEETGEHPIKLDGLVTVYSILVQPEGISGKIDMTINASVTGEEKALPVLDGKASLSVPWNNKKQVEFTATGFEKHSETFEGIANEKESRTISLKRSPTVYSVELKTKDAKVELNGEPVTVTNSVADVRVPFAKKKSVLKVSRKYHKEVTKDIEWNESLVGKIDPISLEAEARPLELKVLPATAKWEIHLGEAKGEVAEIGSDGKAMIPFGIEKFFVTAAGFREVEKTIEEELFKELLEVQLISSNLPVGLEPVAGTTFSPLLNLPMKAKLTFPDARGEMIFLLMEAREFPFGSAELGKDELKKEMVKLGSAYYLGQTEVTHGQFGLLNRGGESDLPVSGIQWSQADEYCRKIHPNGRLPTEIEWEAAATNYGTRLFPWGNDELEVKEVLLKARLSLGGNVADDKPVSASYQMDSGPGRDQFFEFLHMFGNVQEFCADKLPGGGNDAVGSVGEHITRGCSFLTPWSLGSAEERATRLTWRGSKKDDLSPVELEDVGFRVLIEVLPTAENTSSTADK